MQGQADLLQRVNQISRALESAKSIPVDYSPAPTKSIETAKPRDPQLDIMVRNLDIRKLIGRIVNCLEKQNIMTVGQLLEYSEHELMQFDLFGLTCLESLRKTIQKLGYGLGCNKDRFIRRRNGAQPTPYMDTQYA